VRDCMQLMQFQRFPHGVAGCGKTAELGGPASFGTHGGIASKELH